MQTRLMLMWCICGLFLIAPAEAIEPNPTDAQVAKALADGKAVATQPFKVPNQYGKPGACGWGFIQTKLVDLHESVREAARKFKDVPPEEQQRILKQPNVIVWYVLCTDEQKPGEIHLVIKQGETIIQPTHVSKPDVDTTPSWPNTPAYSATISAEFPYSAIPDHANATIVVVPPIGNRLEYPVSLADYP